MKVNSKPNYYGILPAQVRYDTALTNLAKLLYCEISALASKDGICFATNGYFAKLYDSSERTISRAICSLEENGYVKITRHKKKGDVKVVKREIELMTKMSIDKDKNVQGNNIKIINNNIILDKNVSMELFKELSSIAIGFYTEQEKNFSAIIPKWNNENYINQSVNLLYKLISKDKYNIEDVRKALNWAINDTFWASKVLTLTTLRKRAKNGNTKFTNLYLSYTGSVKPSKYQGGVLS
jgi:hypothetical protein|tara:strand:+ start:182 stop:898 length:717 start_codon:yes stop_codon:yes gene_type:complete